MKQALDIDQGPRITLQSVRKRASNFQRFRQILALIVFAVLLVVAAIAMTIIGVITLFQSRRFQAEKLGRSLARAGLWLHGVRMHVHREEPWPDGQVVYISNHTSALDPLVIIALGLPNSRFFMGGFLRKIVPLWIVGSLMGTFWTSPQKYPDRRQRLFQNAAELLGRTGESVFLTPEGQKCWVFNKGAFHLAMSLGAPIVPFFIHIPDEVDPGPWIGGRKFEIRAGDTEVYFKPPIDTSSWKLSELDQRRFEVRDFYLNWASELNDKSLLAPEAQEAMRQGSQRAELSV